MNDPVLTAADIEALMAEHFPEAKDFAEIVEVAPGEVTLRLVTKPHQLRPGGTVSGPTLMALADTAMYYLALSLVGPEALTVTTNLNIDFLRRPTPGTLIAKATLLKQGRQLVVGRVDLRHEGAQWPVAHATVTYSVPPKKG